MSKDVYLDPTTHDLDISNGLLRLSHPQQETTRQKTKIMLSGFRGECFWDIEGFGIPYLANDNNPIQLLGKQSTNKRMVDVYIKEAILSREGVVEITEYTSSLNPETRTLSVAFTFLSESGETIPVEGVEITIGG